MTERLEMLEAFIKSPVTKWGQIYNSICALGCLDERFTRWENFVNQRVIDIFDTLEWWQQNRRNQIIEESMTGAAGFSRVLNRLRTSEETPVTTLEQLIPYPIPGRKASGFAVTDRDRNTIKRLKKKGYLTDRQETIFIQLGVLTNG